MTCPAVTSKPSSLLLLAARSPGSPLEGKLLPGLPHRRPYRYAASQGLRKSRASLSTHLVPSETGPAPLLSQPSAPEVLEVLELEALAGISMLGGPCTDSSPSAPEVLEVMKLEVEEALALAPPTGPLEVLTCPDGKGGEATFYILGTAHASEASCRDAAALIRLVRPDIVMVELCRERAPMLGMQETEDVTLGQVLAAIAGGQVPPFAGVYGWLLAKKGKELRIVPGAEFRAAMRAAHEVGAKVALGDRPISITLARTWHALSLREKLSLVTSMLWTGLAPANPDKLKEDIEHMKETDVTERALEGFAKDFPSIVRPLLTERDEYMVYIMREKLAPRWRTHVVVVGAGHLKGIREKWEAKFDFDEIMRMPKERHARDEH